MTETARCVYCAIMVGKTADQSYYSYTELEAAADDH